MRPLVRSLLLVVALTLGAHPAFAQPKAAKGDPALQARLEAALKRQPKMVAETLAKLEPQRPGVRDLYFVGVALYGDQNVFRKEVERVRELFDTRFDTRGRSLVLVNNPDTLDHHPLATAVNLNAVLKGIGRRIDPAEDLVFLFMTSHGQRGAGLVVRLNGRNLGPISPAGLSRTLGEAGLRQRVVLVSACFSGQFVPPLRTKGSLIMTAAAADRTSFGCTNTAEWTWFGESYFVDALPKTGQFVPAFRLAAKIVAERERKAKERPSNPQISVGSEIARILREIGY